MTTLPPAAAYPYAPPPLSHIGSRAGHGRHADRHLGLGADDAAVAPRRTSAPTSPSSTRACRSAEIQATLDAAHAAAGRQRDGHQAVRVPVQAGHLRHRRAAAADQGRLLHRDLRPRRLARPTWSSTARSRSTTAAWPSGGTANCLALVNFWRTLSNLSININAAGQDGCRASAQLLGGVPGRLDAPAQRQRRHPVADGLLHRRPAVRQRRLHRRLQAAGTWSTARSSSG